MEPKILSVITTMIIVIILGLIMLALFLHTLGYLAYWMLLLFAIIASTIFFFSLLFWGSKWFSRMRNILSSTYIILAFLYFLAIIFLFARIYQDLGGIVDNSGTVVTEASTCLYFSIVTFTTLGYGDFHPTNVARGIAAFEALLGYMCMGILIGVVVFLLTRQHQYALAAELPPPLS